MSEVILLAGAEIEFHTAYARLAESSPHRAELFDIAVQKGLHQIGWFPRSAPEHIGRYRRLLISHFPYALYYAIEGSCIFVHALLDPRLPPASIRRRLSI